MPGTIVSARDTTVKKKKRDKNAFLREAFLLAGDIDSTNHSLTINQDSWPLFGIYTPLPGKHECWYYCEGTCRGN